MKKQTEGKIEPQIGMRAKNIKSIISKKVQEWTDSIEHEPLRELVKKNVIVTGGCIASMLLGEKVKDFDIYLRSYDTAKALAEYYLSKFQSTKKAGIETKLTLIEEDGRLKIIVKSAGIASEEGTDTPYQYFENAPEGEASKYVDEIITEPDEIEDKYEETEKLAQETTDNKKKYRPVFLTTNAITLSDRIQIVIRFQGEPDQIHENYDFVHCTNYWTSWDNNLVLRPKALEALLARELVYVGSRYPICSVVRLRKFIQRGWHVNAGQIVKMALQIGELNLKDFKVLEDQLTGVDTAYFIELIAKVKAHNPDQVDSAYLCEVIDRIF